MNDKKFIKALVITLLVCIVLTVAHMGYIMYAYENSSIIYFISQEFWP
ncbi:MAG: hypothetical protein IK142_01495 [Clostridiales bacterium]|jgi:hypothetical protein|nr:hypothetical protein [Clostridiales bacterium]MCR5201043.1 hypothetical protein [Saccharofermentans sp.]